MRIRSFAQRRALSVPEPRLNMSAMRGVFGRKAPAPQPAAFDEPPAHAKGRIFFDISDLVIFLLANTKPTGIQRVELSIMNEVAKSPDLRNIHFGFFVHRKNRMMTISPAHLGMLTGALSGASQGRIRLVLLKIVFGAQSTKVLPRETYVILGAFWISRYYTAALSGLKACGVIAGAFIHDLIPLTHPQFIRPTKLVSMQKHYDSALALLDFACTNSNYVAGEVTRVLATRLRRKIPVAAAPLAHDAEGLRRTAAGGEIDLPALPAEYVLCVGSLDGRKNHVLLVSIWRDLNSKYAGRIPCLVLAGKWWRNSDALRDMLQRTNQVDGKIILLGGVPDGALARLYKNCLFTVFPSFVEGWGLPVGESLSFGKPCIASSTSSIPEVGGDLVRYIDPYDPAGAALVIEQVLMDRAGLAAWADRISREFKPRSWKMMTEDLLTKVAACAADVVPRAVR